MQRKTFTCLLVMVVGACGLLAGAAPRQDQSQTDSVAEAARKAREKKKAATKSPKVISDDDLDRRNFQPGQDGLNVGSAPRLETEPPSPEAVAAAEASDAAAEKEAAKKAADDDAELARLKGQLTTSEKDLDLAQRALALDQDAYLSKPDYANDAAGKAKLDSEKQQISDMQQEVEKLKTRVAALEESKKRRKPRKGQAAQPAQGEKPTSPGPENSTPPQL
jgi:DNA repair exonuclease SbcCD ATPase subunit